MHLTVYFHHKPVVYEKMLVKYRESEKPFWTLPGEVDSFARFVDSTLFEKLKSAENNDWADRILNKNPYLRLYECSYFSPDPDKITEEEEQVAVLQKKLTEEDIPFISANSSDHSLQPVLGSIKKDRVFVRDRWTGVGKTLFEKQAIFKLQKRQIHRIYVPPNYLKLAQNFVF